MKSTTQTIEITNFSGKLTRTLTGTLNSGYAKFAPSYGYDFFSKPGNLTWLEQPKDITGPIHGLPLTGKNRWISENNPSVYIVTSTGGIYQLWVSDFNTGGVNPQAASVVGSGSVLAGGASYVYGASMDFYGVPSVVAVSSTVTEEKIFVGSDNQVNSIRFNATADAVVGSVVDYTPNKYHPLKKFIGVLLVGDGQAVSSIDNTNTVKTSVFGALPTEVRVRDIDVSPDGNYALISASTSDYEQMTATATRVNGSIPSEGTVFYWNGADLSPTAFNSIPASQVTALQTYLQNNTFFITDSMGSGISDGTRKILSLPNNKAPFPNATGTNGDFLFWNAIEKVPFAGSYTLVASMYYYGTIDEQSGPGLYRLFRDFSTISGNILQSPLNLLASTGYSDTNASRSSVVTVGYGQHYYSTLDVSDSASVLSLKSFAFPPTGTGTLQGGVYETQTQLFPKKIQVKQARIYTEPTIAGNAFTFALIGPDGNALTIDNNGNAFKLYQFTAGTDPTLLQGSLTRININPEMDSTHAIGVRITNSGSTNMTINKIELDIDPSGE